MGIRRGHLRVWSESLVLTFLIEGKLVVAQTAGLLAHKLVHIVSAQGAYRDGIGEGLHTGLQAEGDLGVAHGVPGGRQVP